MKARIALVLLSFALIFLSACSSQPTANEKSAKPAPKPTEAVTGREAFQKLYVQARGWSPDAKLYRLQSSSTSDSSGQDGKSAVWRASFASPSRRMMKPYLWSGSAAPGAERGLSWGTEDSWNSTNTSTREFDIAFLKVDSDVAYKVAQEHGGDKLIKADSKQPVQYILEWDTINNDLVWHVIYGNSINDAKLRVAVNASDGKFIRVEK